LGTASRGCSATARTAVAGNNFEADTTKALRADSRSHMEVFAGVAGGSLSFKAMLQTLAFK